MSAIAATPNLEELAVARVYADAIWHVAARQKIAEEFCAEFASLVEILDQFPDLEAFFKDDSLDSAVRLQMTERVFGGRISELLFAFLRTLNKHERRGGLLRAVGLALAELLRANRGTVMVIARTATPLDDEQKRRLEEFVAKQFDIKPEMQHEVDPALLGGLWLRIGDIVYDRSVRTNLSQLRDNILTRSSHEIKS